MGECTGQYPHIPMAQRWIVNLREQKSICKQGQAVAVAIGAQVVNGGIGLDPSTRLHLTLPKQGGLAVIEDPDAVIAVAADHKEVVLVACITADQADAILIRAGDLTSVCFNVHIAKILVRHGPEVDLQGIDQYPESPAIVIHRALRRLETVPAAGRGGEVVFEQYGSRRGLIGG